MNITLLPLRDGNKIPLLAFGTGTAWFNEVSNTDFNQNLVDLTKEEVGIAIQESGVPREKLFITNKAAQGMDDMPQRLSRVSKTNATRRDLIHIPFFAKPEADFGREWKSMEEVKMAGKARSIGVSNYLRSDVEATLRGATIPPALSQNRNDIQVGSFKGLTPAFRAPDGPLRQPLARIAKAHDTTEAAVLINWIIQSIVVAVTTTTKPETLDEYAQDLKIKLTEDELWREW
ncbi:NAD/NADP-dependent indole-3-acetaldehyde reductase [Phialemonium atrogriseum]|uniref:NAD/NADP-dependent indole-3-acetaldehyde reductase n=1 Tax=Phialemonium atrogriseum TaxID=1093897 RepID=A0AAJ0BRP0_9PEZI|nr:NAD/NADP-dependent indole-3-acetaldehyde reductase [Phialemonium atrogriseum]KAK1763000.1 NAD/NADP-dependent indole-3-acetaldehyde reductase [Phialemonium atrogriseum]